MDGVAFCDVIVCQYFRKLCVKWLNVERLLQNNLYLCTRYWLFGVKTYWLSRCESPPRLYESIRYRSAYPIWGAAFPAIVEFVVNLQRTERAAPFSFELVQLCLDLFFV